MLWEVITDVLPIMLFFELFVVLFIVLLCYYAFNVVRDKDALSICGCSDEVDGNNW